jgi:ATP-dependent 26S proteasome regulatory subunit
MDTKQQGIKTLVGNYGEIFFPEDITKTAKELVGLEEPKKFLGSFFNAVKNIKKYGDLPLPFRASALLEGVPGTGKTALVMAMAKEYEIPILVVFASKLIDQFLGKSQQNLDSLMEACLYAVDTLQTPLIVFFDELDSIASERANEHEVGEIKRLVIGFIQNIDRLLAKGKPIGIIGATNHVKSLDSAVFRRFTFKFKFDYPDRNTRLKIFELFKKKFEDRGFLVKVDLSMLENDKQAFADGYTGSDIERVFEIAQTYMISIEKTVITTDLFQAAMKFVEGTRNQENMYSIQQRLHEAKEEQKTESKQPSRKEVHDRS